MFERQRTRLAGAVAGAIDLAVDFATLGEYGLEPVSADATCELDGHRAAWEALASPRRGNCARARSRRFATRAAA
jgi:hypothetical protein